MAEGADLYINAEVQAARPILDNLLLGGMAGAEVKDFLDMSRVLTAAVFEGRDSGGGQRFYAAASGRFPASRGGLFFSASKDWEKKTSLSGIPYWHSDKSQLAVFLDPRNAYLSNGDPFAPAPGAQPPEALETLRKGAVLSGWMNDPAPAIGRIIAAFGVPAAIPARRLIFAVYPEGGNYTAVLRFETAAAAQANALVRLFTMAKAFAAMADFSQLRDMEALARAFFAGTPRAEDNALILKTAVVSGRDLALLFNTISVY
jgi:hypothetical protein